MLVRRGADIGWKLDVVEPVRTCVIRQQVIGGVCMIPGGRWLLVGDAEYGSVTVYDLDYPTLTVRPLIPSNGQDSSYIAIDMEVEQRSSKLTSTLAMSPCVHCGRVSSIYIRGI